MLKLTALLETVEGVTAEDVSLWIARGFVVPEEVEGEVYFGEIDVARVRLIHELAHDLALETDAIALLLSLLDQVYTLRSRLSLLTEVIAAQPPEVREAIRQALGAPAEPEEGD